MSAYDDMREVIEDARIDDECSYSVYSQMFDLIGDAEEENGMLRIKNIELRKLATDACTVLRSHYDKEWFDGTVLAERMRALGIEVPE